MSIGRTAQELEAWQILFDACSDDCEKVELTKIQQQSILAVEAELRRLHLIEEQAIKLAILLGECDFSDEDENWADYKKSDYWDDIARFQIAISNLVPNAEIAFSHDAKQIQKNGKRIKQNTHTE